MATAATASLEELKADLAEKKKVLAAERKSLREGAEGASQEKIDQAKLDADTAAVRVKSAASGGTAAAKPAAKTGEKAGSKSTPKGGAKAKDKPAKEKAAPKERKPARGYVQYSDRKFSDYETKYLGKIQEPVEGVASAKAPQGNVVRVCQKARGTATFVALIDGQLDKRFKDAVEEGYRWIALEQETGEAVGVKSWEGGWFAVGHQSDWSKGYAKVVKAQDAARAKAEKEKLARQAERKANRGVADAKPKGKAKAEDTPKEDGEETPEEVAAEADAPAEDEAA